LRFRGAVCAHAAGASSRTGCFPQSGQRQLMNKGVLVGGGLGLLALAFLAGIWLMAAPVESSDEQRASAPATVGVQPSRVAPGQPILPPSSAPAAEAGP